MKRAIVVTLAAALLVGGSIGPAGAHVKKTGSNVRIRVSDTTPEKGNRVTFKAKVKSANAQCKADRTVKLIRNSKVIASKTTNAKGVAKFTKRITKKGKYWFKATKKVLNLAHPHRHVCTPDLSRKKLVRPHT